MKNLKVLLVAITAASALGAASTAFAAAPTSGDMSVSATLTSACEVQTSGSIDFGSVVALASTGDQAVSNATGLTVACSNGLSPSLYSATDRNMLNGADQLPFDLCVADCTGSNGMGASSDAATPIDITTDGSLHAVPLYARIKAADFKGLPAGAYSKTVTINVLY
ncbi:MAG TPA: spore coat protein U domain-containing protein [Ramlibacter sp.]|uniref:spore coat protein U domain-containing protein n=1 Tax=Ramlibacter sp. TaxID=1917967 RepID=UPI002C206AD3|nr:spore coat protein U domain-containing protein [Ramlibacter sp.]HVZ45626.1 spore coat protein U domain-containing protein [Ramlibacter sp.]